MSNSIIDKLFKKNKPYEMQDNLDTDLKWQELITHFIDNKINLIRLFIKPTLMPVSIGIMFFFMHISFWTLLLIVPLSAFGMLASYDITRFNLLFKKQHLNYKNLLNEKEQIKIKLYFLLKEKKIQLEIVENLNFYIEKEKENHKKSMLINEKNMMLKNLSLQNYEQAIEFMLKFFNHFDSDTLLATFYEKSLSTIELPEVKTSLKKKESKYLEML